MSFEFKLPDLGEGIREAEILGVKIADGQHISEDQILFEVETDKAVVEIPSPVSGTVDKVNVKVGQLVPVGSVMISINQDVESKSKLPNVNNAATADKNTAQNTQKVQSPDSSNADKTITGSAESRTIAATPATRQMARELKIDLQQVAGTGPGGRILKEDVLAYAQNKTNLTSTKPGTTVLSSAIKDPALQPTLLPDFSKYGQIERVPMRSVRRKTAQLMAQSWAKIPHVTHIDEADVTALESARNKWQDAQKNNGAKVKLTVTSFIMKAVCLALQEYPDFNTSYDEQKDEIIFKRYYNIGMAVATTRGLVVPVIQSVNTKTILELATDINRVAETTRSGKTELADLYGATFTVTNIGSIGGIAATPIIHYPEAAILAVMKTQARAVVKNGKIESALIVPLCLGFDHRLADGAEAARFLRSIIKMLEDPSSFEKYLGI